MQGDPRWWTDQRSWQRSSWWGATRTHALSLSHTHSLTHKLTHTHSFSLTDTHSSLTYTISRTLSLFLSAGREDVGFKPAVVDRPAFLAAVQLVGRHSHTPATEGPHIGMLFSCSPSRPSFTCNIRIYSETYTYISFSLNQLVYLHPPQQSHPLSPLHEPLHWRAKRDPKA